MDRLVKMTSVLVLSLEICGPVDLQCWKNVGHIYGPLSRVLIAASEGPKITMFKFRALHVWMEGNFATMKA